MIQRDGAAIWLEPAGPLELSGAPLATQYDTHAELHAHFAAALDAGEPLRLRRASLLPAADRRQTLTALYRMHDPLYREYAHALVDTAAQDVARATTDVLTALLAWIDAAD
ncbi:hypothetical protein [Burkholderia sp. D-99]|uniref:hypothetical protein n=1 Tax=Burkholderia sp. D-99 TaxID=2717316 RepID=UPI00141D7968|nr:hypothetical protein [Burkholderia sp. D-99]NHV31110.1 hypothetical protein [Burkholderia sp. D-99]